MKGYLADTGQAERLQLFERATDREIDSFESSEAWYAFDDSVLLECEAQWLAGVPSRGGSNQAAFDVFFEALGTGDRALAATVATQRALTSDGWQGYNDRESLDEPGTLTNPIGSYQENSWTASMTLAPTLHLYCDLAEGVVLSCTAGE